MEQFTEQDIRYFAETEFPGKTIWIGEDYWFIQAGNCLGSDLHYEFHNNQVHLDIEGRNWRGIRDYLKSHVIDSRVTSSHWARYDCRWTLHQQINSWEDLQKAFLLIKKIMDPHIMKYERNIGETKVEDEHESLTAQFIFIQESFKKKLAIPEYQRPYRWQEKNVAQLLSDILYSKSNGKLQYLIGTIILHKKNDTYNIVDGQQRITTLILLLKALGYKDSLPALLFNHTDSFANIQDNYLFINTWINQNIPDKNSLLTYILSSCCFVEIIVENLSEAFQMFESQNGRGKELEAYNLLKAYHIRAMSNSPYVDKISCDTRWEDATMFLCHCQRKDILAQLFNEQLYRTRIWSRGESAYRFSKKHIDEFKGVTLDGDHSIGFAYQNLLLQQDLSIQLLKNINSNLLKIKSRFIHGDPANINPFVNINQLFLNGKSFFDYVETYVEIYKRIFLQLDSSQLAGFKQFYTKYCCYEGYTSRRGDEYIRQVYKSAIMMTFDRFGEEGVNYIFQDIYICLYKTRLEQKQVRYESMAKNSNVAWIFQTIFNAKNLSDLNVIRVNAVSYIEKPDWKFLEQNIIHFFELYRNGQTK